MEPAQQPQAESTADTVGSAAASAGEGRAAKRSPAAMVLVTLAVLSVAAIVAMVLGASAEETHAEVAVNPDVPHLDKDAIVVPARFAARAGLVIEAVAEGKVNPEVRVVGQVTFDPAHVAAVGVRARGLIRKLAKVEGDGVLPDDLLAEVESSELASA